jgi:Rieske Fe-S protein
MTGFQPSRRIVFQGLGALGVAAVLAGCGGDDSSDGGNDAPDSGAELASTSEVPVGGGLVLTDEQIVLTQPTAGEFKAVSAACTHQGTLVDELGEEGIRCPNHGSLFSPEDGSVTQGPATKPLPAVEITVDGDKILAA